MTGLSRADLVERCLDLRADAMAEAHYLTGFVSDRTAQGSLHDSRTNALVSDLAGLVMAIDKLVAAIRLTQRIADAAGVGDA
jgi:hypothetical protein